MKVNVKKCARCAEDHDELEFKELINAADEWNWWAMCPSFTQPILMKVMMQE